jgi:Glycosyl transferase family 90
MTSLVDYTYIMEQDERKMRNDHQRRINSSMRSSSNNQMNTKTIVVCVVLLLVALLNNQCSINAQEQTTTATTNQLRASERTSRRLEKLATVTAGVGIGGMESSMHTLNDNTVSSSTRTNPIVDYMNAMKGGQNNIVVLKWSPDGILRQYSPVRNRMWFRKQSQNGTYKETQPSQYGTVALLLNTDILQFLDWTLVPPVPILIFTMPDKFVNDTHYHLLPDPYDLYGFNEFCVWRLNQLVGSDLTYEKYMARKNSVVWRGESHADMDPVRQIIINMSNKLEEEIRINPHNTSRWLDVADTKVNPSAKLEMEELVANYRYQIDIGGVSGTSWGGTRWKLCMGSFTFKVDTFSKDWWHFNLVPWEHYVPVKADLSDLHDMYLWAEANPQRAYEISQKGKQKCLESLPQHLAEEVVTDVIKKIPPAPSQHIIDSADDIYANHLHYFVPTSEDKDWNGGYTEN